MYYIVSVFFMLLCAKSNILADTESSYFILDLVLIWIGIEKRRFKKSDFILFFKFSLIYLVFVSARFFLLNHLSTDFLISDINFLVKFIFLSFLYCAVLKDKAIYYITQVTIIGALISLPLYFLQLVAGDFLFGLGRVINFNPNEVTATYSNFLFFTYDRLHAIRNSGFGWEPGAFGCFLNLGLLLYFLINNFIFDKKALILVIAIVTTLSTTSYLALAIVMLIYFRANDRFNVIYIIAGAVVLAVVSVTVPFLSGKIIQTYNNDLSDVDRFDFLNGYYLKHGGQMPLNRFASVIFLYKTFGYKLIWGISNIYPDADETLKNVNISNGLIDFIAKFGVVGLVYLIYNYVLLFKKFFLRNELILYSVLVLLFLSFGEPLLIFLSTLMFFFLFHYNNPVVDLKTEENNDSIPLQAVQN